MPARGDGSIFSCSIFPAVRILCLLFALLSWLPITQAQTARAAANLPSAGFPRGDFQGNGFQSTVRQSGLIFDGTVAGIQCEFGKDKTPQTYRISFRVRQGVRGARSGTTVAIREWAGLREVGTGHGPRYRVGERVFLFLYPSSQSGLTSTVGGRKGFPSTG